MINGEGPSSAVASSWDRESDGGDDLSHYSSCGGESEFDRYCSASSAMGTPSFRGGSYQDSDFGSSRSFKIGGENANYKSFGADGVLSGSLESEPGMSNSNGKMEDFRANFDVGDNWGNRVLIRNSEGSVRVSGDFGEIAKDGKDRDLSDEVESSSRSEHSEGEDSMFGCNSDDEKKIDSYYEKNMHFRGGESERKENQLVMNSAVAFGSDDWDDFVQESGGNAIGSMGWDEIRAERWAGTQSDMGSLNFMASSLVGGKFAEKNMNTSSTNSRNLVKLDEQFEDATRVVASSNDVNDMDELASYLGCDSGYDLFQMNKDPLEKEIFAKEKLKIGESESEVKIEDTASNEVMAIRHNKSLEEKSVELDSLTESGVNHRHLVQANVKEDKEAKLIENNSLFATPSFVDTTKSATIEKNHSFTFDQIEDHFVPVKKRDFELNDFYDEIVNDMEDILLDSGELPDSRFTRGTKIYQSHFSQSSRDGGSTASTSGTNYALKIDKIEVVGASQRKGDVSFSERLVGVQKYTVYKIRVSSGAHHWEVERRYRDFNSLYHRLKKQFDDHGWALPSPWSSVERESRKLFGNASPNAVADRSVLIEECLQSVIHPKFSLGSFNALVSFLSQSEMEPDSPNTSVSNRSELGKTISLVVENRPLKSMKQMLDAQHYRCAGCHRSFDDGRTRVLELVQALGWGKPRLCEYSGQLFCSSCHNNDAAVLPARVLHYWDFTRYPVSQMAKSFLDSITDQPMLCVGAVNPFLFSKVPTLQHVANIRSRIRAMLPYVRCPFRRSIYKGLGSRSYLLESNDFFALKDLISLSKGVFSALPVMVETVSRKIHEHITEQCLVCYDVGIPCSARKDCNDPLSLIFPFQHEATKQSSDEGVRSVNSNLNLLQKRAEPSAGFLADLFSKVIPGRPQVLRKSEPKGFSFWLVNQITRIAIVIPEGDWTSVSPLLTQGPTKPLYYLCHLKGPVRQTNAFEEAKAKASRVQIQAKARVRIEAEAKAKVARASIQG
ncbi:pleckstrin homology domain-containing family m member 3 [Phtheirospermum japonicum]|uniref:Pleckstrin homology domain-containing family m member 3 n=1 Tax=Phtheirospermum japonicum TaxID=374723 RepID=A0A830CDL3_9LAMI|nr:pleckstrin homology domain-containing family m member 3 [Phtheirospermum japonicum]